VTRACIRFVRNSSSAVCSVTYFADEKCRLVCLWECRGLGHRERVLRFNLVWTLRRSLVSLKQRNFYVSETLVNIKQHTYCRTWNSYPNTVSICFMNFVVPFDTLRKMDFGKKCCCRINTKWNRILLRDFVRSAMNVWTVSQIICC